MPRSNFSEACCKECSEKGKQSWPWGSSSLFKFSLPVIKNAPPPPKKKKKRIQKFQILKNGKYGLGISLYGGLLRYLSTNFGINSLDGVWDGRPRHGISSADRQSQLKILNNKLKFSKVILEFISFPVLRYFFGKQAQGVEMNYNTGIYHCDNIDV